MVNLFEFLVTSADPRKCARGQKHVASKRGHEGYDQKIGTGQKTSRSEKSGSNQDCLSAAADHHNWCRDDEGQQTSC